MKRCAILFLLFLAVLTLASIVEHSSEEKAIRFHAWANVPAQGSGSAGLIGP